MSTRPRLSISDLLHRGYLGIVMMGVVHRDTLRRGRAHAVCYQALALQEANSNKEKQSEENEIALAQAAQAALDRSGKSW
ncbi:uncharacterized protein B0H18DRAFT_973575 [Fomitopsis serialis]|uniref:uncharacterized protein n=1 Tax=Fomitopsis serialis TaxID=139415 RepID=UPI0020078650|nr:uncharacterized protein B0H18DRAFT_973575 [Neoantrodia serialis]KAH9936364.1 hypothetical protein B0H18DRAFT_973575 [Neoantrodia serialis]